MLLRAFRVRSPWCLRCCGAGRLSYRQEVLYQATSGTVFSLSPREKKPCTSVQLPGPVSLFLFLELPGLPAANSAPLAPLGFLLDGLHPSSLRSHSLAVTAVLMISPGLLSNALTLTQRSPLLPGIAAFSPSLPCETLLLWKAKVSECVGCSFVPSQAVSSSVLSGLFPPVSFVRSNEEAERVTGTYSELSVIWRS